MVRDPGVEPSTVDADIVDSSMTRAEPSTLKADIEDGSMTRAGPSMLMLHFADGSILQDRTFHALGLNHGWFGIQELNLPR